MYSESTAGKLPCSETLEARVFDYSESPSIFGYDIETDLLQHYSLQEVLLLTLTGELPDKKQSLLLSVVLTSLVAGNPTDDYVHGGILTRTFSNAEESILPAVAPIAAQRTLHLLNSHQPFIEWLKNPTEPLPEIAVGSENKTQPLIDALQRRGVKSKFLDFPLTTTAARFALLFEAGLTERWQLQFICSWMALLAPTAEAMARPSCAFLDYPIRLPRFVESEQ